MTTGGAWAARIRRVAMFPLAFALVAGVWELYKLVGPEDGASVLGLRLLPRTGDIAMPHVWDMAKRLGRPEVRGGDQSVLRVVLFATWYSLRTAFTAFVVGTLLGVGLAVLMARFKVVERALMPYLVVSQTVPIIVASFTSDFTTSFSFINAAGVVAIVPPVAIAVVFERYIVSGLTAGAVKG